MYTSWTRLPVALCSHSWSPPRPARRHHSTTRPAIIGRSAYLSVLVSVSLSICLCLSLSPDRPGGSARLQNQPYIRPVGWIYPSSLSLSIYMFLFLFVSVSKSSSLYLSIFLSLSLPVSAISKLTQSWISLLGKLPT